MSLAWTVGALPVLCAGAALLELDGVRVGQCMLSRPIVAGPLLGLAAGSPWTGLSMGLLLELMTIDELPVGNVVPLNGTVATAAAVLLSAGPWEVAEAAALPAGIAVGWAFSRIERSVRARLSWLSEEAVACAQDGRAVPWSRLIGTGLGFHAGACALFLFAAVAALSPALSWCWAAAPETVRRGLHFAYAAAPWLGWSAALTASRPR